MRWTIHIINPADKTKLCYTSHQHSTTVSLELATPLDFNWSFITIMVSKNCPIIGEHVAIIFVTQ